MAAPFHPVHPAKSEPPQFREPINGNRFFYLELNMHYTQRAWENRSEYRLIRLAQQIAHIALIPFIAIATFEVVVKNGLYLLINIGVAAANQIHALLYKKGAHAPTNSGPWIEQDPGQDAEQDWNEPANDPTAHFLAHPRANPRPAPPVL